MKGSYNHRIKKLQENDYIISWTVDYKYSRRFLNPRNDWRNADQKGAERFSKKHGIDMPTD